MAIGIVGRKAGMTRVFNDSGESIPVTVIEVQANKISQVKTDELDGYNAIQVSVGEKKTSHTNKAEAGHFAKAGITAGSFLCEFRTDGVTEEVPGIGGELKVDQFEEGQLVDVIGQSKGKGFAGGVKRWNFRMQDATHGNSLSHRAPGSIGQCQTPGRVFKGKKMAGQLGAARVTVQSLRVVRVDQERNLLLIRGAVPGANGSSVVVKPAVKA
ncbi:MAG: 50S ribosomal protein L3 [Gammaproteobacteria bacterium]|nr:MAG: 50S ribosomal protein L3 [Gammaproteobacteria bacterium]